MSKLLVKPMFPDALGRVHNVTPQSAGWHHVGFAVHKLADGQILTEQTGSYEHCLVLLSGTVEAIADGVGYGMIGGRSSPFEPDPWSLYIPAASSWHVTAQGACELAVCAAPGKPGRSPRLIAPEDVACRTQASGNNVCHLRSILPESEPADSLLVVEVVTPSGNWSNTPADKHDPAKLQQASLLEMTCYHRLSHPEGFALRRIYTDDRSLDATICAEDGDLALVPRGYYPVAVSPGSDLYCLHVMAGPDRIRRIASDPAHAWIMA